MDTGRQGLDRESAAQMLQWWLESGVDTLVDETPRQWLKKSTTPVPAPVEAPAAEKMPDDLGAFRHWLSESPGLPLDRPGARRILPTGDERAEVMILCDAPQVEDGEQPVGGEAAVLLGKMLAAIGFTREQSYVASLACFQSPGAKLGAGDLERCAEIARHHVRAVKPKRLILLGDNPAKALLAAPIARARGHIHKIEGVRTIATFHPRWLIQRPGDKALAWRDLLLLMEEEL